MKIRSFFLDLKITKLKKKDPTRVIFSTMKKKGLLSPLPPHATGTNTVYAPATVLIRVEIAATQ